MIQSSDLCLIGNKTHISILLSDPKFSECTSTTRCMLVGLVAILFLLIFSPLVGNVCGGGASMHVGKMGPMCHVQAMGTAGHPDNTMIDAIVPLRSTTSFGALLLYVSLLIIPGLVVSRRLSVDVIYRMKFMRWLWSRPFPFISSNNFIPYFMPMRDA